MSAALRDCVAWLAEHDAELTITGWGPAEIKIDGEVLASREDFGADPERELHELLEEAKAPRDQARLTAPAVIVEQTWFGLGVHFFAWEEQRKVTFTPMREFDPRGLIVPSTVSGYTVVSAHAAGVDMLPSAGGIPCELFSEVSTAPQIIWPALGPEKPLTMVLRAPACPKAPNPFLGAMYGVALEKK